MSSPKKDVFILIVRLIIGAVFIAAGWAKIGSAAAAAMTVGYFAQMGIPAFLAYAVGYIEVIGGALIVLGLWSCFASFVLGVVMLFAIWYSRSMGFGGMALPAATLAGCLSLIASGAGKFAVRLKRGGGAMIG